jgi:hypothetical protein
MTGRGIHMARVGGEVALAVEHMASFLKQVARAGCEWRYASVKPVGMRSTASHFGIWGGMEWNPSLPSEEIQAAGVFRIRWMARSSSSRGSTLLT